MTLSSISTTSNNIIADGVSQATVTIVLKDGMGKPVPNIIPLYGATDTASTNSYSVCPPTDFSGQTTCTFTSTKAQGKNLMLLSPIFLPGNSVSFIAGPPSAAGSAISSSSSPIADGIDSASVEIYLGDTFSNPVAGAVPTFSATDTGGSNNYSVCSVTDADGISLCSFTSTKAETKTLSVTTPIVKMDGVLTFVAGPAVAANTTITGTSSTYSNGIDESTITITLKDQFANNIQGVVPTFSATGGGNIYGTCSSSNSSGVSSCKLRSVSQGVKTLSVTSPVNKAGGTVTFEQDDPPIANAITPSSFNEDSQSIISLSYTDPEGDPATSCALSGLSNVIVTQTCACSSGTCSVGVTGLSDYSGAAGFNYIVASNGLSSNLASATFTITAVDDAPVALALSPASFAEDTQSIITLSYTDIESHSATSCAITGASNVTVTQACACVSGTCTVGVTGTTDYIGAANFNYSVTANGLTSNSAAVSLNITAVDDAPVTNAINPGSFAEDTQSVISLGYSDSESHAATSCAISGASNVIVTQPCACTSGSCSVGVTGAANFNGAGSFNYIVFANGLSSNSSAVNFTITAVDDAPVADAITPASFAEDTQSIISLVYTDVESHAATSCDISAPSNVTVTQACACAAGSCSVGVTSTADFNGAASFNYTVTANGLTSNSASASLTVDSIDDAPVASAITPSAFAEDTQSVINLIYSDTESHAATSCSISGTSNVTVTQACACAVGSCTVGVTGTANYNGAASFNYTVTANGLTSNSASANLNISAVDDAPVASALTPGSFAEDTQSIISLVYFDVESHSATSCSISGTSNVTVTQVCACAAGSCSVGVTGTANYNGSASFNYTVTANGLISNSASANFTITTIDDAPVASALTPGSFAEDTQSVINLIYSDTESHAATSCSLSGTSNVTVTQACACAVGSCTVGVTGTANYNGAASFNYTVTANGLTSNSASANLNITAVDDAPVASALTPGSFAEDTQSVIALVYSDIESHPATTCSISGASNVTVTQACACSSGTCTVGVMGTSNYNGAASFNYSVTANGLTSNSASSTFTITAVDDAPVANAITPGSFAEDTQSVISLVYSDVESHSATSCAISAVTNVTVTQACSCAAGSCTVGVTGTSNYNGAAGFNYTVTANGVTSNSASASLTITPVNDAPTMAAITNKTTAKNTATTSIAVTIADVDHTLSCTSALAMSSSDTSKVSNTGVSWGGTAPNCTAVITPVNNATGNVNLTFTVTDGSAATATNTFQLSITYVSHVWTDTLNNVITLYDFGTPGANTTANVRFRNTGDMTSGTVGFVVADTTYFNVQSHDCTTLAANSFCTVTIQWIQPGLIDFGTKSTTITGSSGSESATLNVQGTR